jgi:putative Ca2+/H+ antiporter (TMEM165/GDT1 family)
VVDLGSLAGFAIVFLVIGGLEVFDRTSFATVALAARSHARATWAGASAAFLLTSAVAVTVGVALITALGPGHIGWLRVGGGAFLIAYAGWVYFHPEEEESPHLREDVRSAFLAAFVTIALLEIGDSTMIFMIVFVPAWGWLVVLAAGASALVAVAAWNVFLGQHLGARLTPRTLNRVVVVALTVVGALTILYGLVPGAFPAL